MISLRLRPDDLSVGTSWRLVHWVLETGSDEFTFSCLGTSPDARFCMTAEAALAAFVIEDAPRPRLTRRIDEGWVRDVHLWRLDEESLAVLRRLLPEGIFTDHQGSTDGWIEDLTFYEGRQIRLGVITHEHEAALNLSESEHVLLREMQVLR